MIRSGSAWLATGLVLAGLAAPAPASARHDYDYAHERYERAHHPHDYPAERYHEHSRKAWKKYQSAYRKWQKQHRRLYGHTPRGYDCHRHAPPRYYYYGRH